MNVWPLRQEASKLAQKCSGSDVTFETTSELRTFLQLRRVHGSQLINRLVG